MKKIIFLLLFFCNSLYSQTTSNYQLDYFKSNLNELKDVNGNNILNSSISDSIVLMGQSTNNNFGFSVSSAGDVNGDGFDDVIVGAYGYANGRGRAYIFLGNYFMDNIADLIMTGQSSSDHFGASVSTAGDVNNDGFSDVVIGHEYKAYIYFGGTSMDTIIDVILDYVNMNVYSVSTAGDVNGDGYDDLIVGSNYTGNYGQAYIFLGGSSMDNTPDLIMEPNEYGFFDFGKSVASAGDVNGDGYSDVIVGSSFGQFPVIGQAHIFFGGVLMNNVPDVILIGETAVKDFGFSVSTAGDVNSDGFSDVIVGAPNMTSPFLVSGKAYIYYGGSPMDNISDVTMIGDSVGNYFGFSVSTAGDINNDDYSDVVVGAYRYKSSIGRCYIYLGDMSTDSTADIILNGSQTTKSFGRSVSTAGDINGDGFSDVIIGATSYNSSTGLAFLYYNLYPKPELIYPANNSVNIPVSISFTWKKLYPVLYYALQISLDSNFNNIIVNDTILLDTFKTISGFQKDEKYFWRVVAKDSFGITRNSSIWNFSTIPPLYTSIKILLEGMYSQIFNQLTRKDSISIYLRESSLPYSLIDSADGSIDSISHSGLFNFLNAPSGSYYLVAKHINCLETWSKAGGENIATDGAIFYYDFTSSNSQAYGNNLKLKGSKYCLYSGDVNQDGFITLFDVIPIYNDSKNFITGRYLTNDLNGDNFVDLADMTICSNNSKSFVKVMRP